MKIFESEEKREQNMYKKRKSECILIHIGEKKNERFYAFVNPMCAFAFSKIFLVSFFDFKVLSTLDQNWFFSPEIQTQFKVNNENKLVNTQLIFFGKKNIGNFWTKNWILLQCVWTAHILEWIAWVYFKIFLSQKSGKSRK